MIRRTDDLRIRDIRPLIPPAILIEELPITGRSASTVAATRAAVAAVLRGDDRRLVAIVGPCSVHDTGAAVEYAERLHDVARRLADDLVIVMRAYFEKPRTVAGWKGLINDPDLDGTTTSTRACASRGRCCSRSTTAACRPPRSSSTPRCRSISRT